MRTWTVRWGNPYTEPPDGSPRVLLSVDDSGLSTSIQPQAIENPTYKITWDSSYEVKRLPEAVRNRTRKINLIRKKYPLFVDEFIKEIL